MADSIIANLSNTSSTGSIYCKYREPDSDTEKIAKRSFLVLFVLLGIAFNVFVIIITVKCTSRKNLHYFIINMAVSDAIMLPMLLLRNIFYLSDGKWSIYPSGTLGVIVCKTMTFIMQISYPVSLITLLVISIERYRATRQRLRIARPYTLKQLVTKIALCWLTPMPMAACLSSVTTVSKSGDNCHWSSFSVYSALYYFIIIVYFLLTLSCFSIFFLSIVTIRRLSKPQAIHAHLSEQQRNLRTSRTRAAVKMVLLSVLLYMICWLPTFIMNNLYLLDYFMKSITIVDYYSACIDWDSFNSLMFILLPLINSMFSPWTYVMMLPDIRESAKKVLCCGERLNQAPNIRNAAIELQEMRRPLAGPNRARNAEDIQELSET